jgi:hypothetical protein
MRVHVFGSLILVTCATVLSGQDSPEPGVDRVIYLTSIQKPQEIQEVATAIRLITEIKSASTDVSHRTLSVRGTAEQVALAESLAKELMAGQGSSAYEYRMSSGDLVQVYYLPHTESVRDFQWAVTAIRSITDLRSFTYNAPRAFVVRGSPEKIEVTEWLVQQLDQPANGRAGSSQYRARDAADDFVSLYFLKHIESKETLEELATFVRNVGDFRKLFTVGPTIAVAMRGTAEEVGLGDWLLQKLDQPASGPAGTEQSQGDASPQFQVSGSGDAVRLFYLRNATIQAFQTVAADVRTAARAPKVFTYNALGAMAVRGTADQIAGAQNMIDERFKKPLQ